MRGKMIDITKYFKEHKIIAMIKETNIAHAMQLGEALIKGGIKIVNISQFSIDGPDVLKLFSTHFPSLVSGGGNVQTVEAAEQAIAHGAQFIFSPKFDQEMVNTCQSARVPIYPVVTDPFLAIENGFRTVSLYPVETLGGARYAQSIFDRFGLTSIVAGGISQDTIASYLKTPAIIAATGSWMIDPKKIEKGDFEGISKDCTHLLESL